MPGYIAALKMPMTQSRVAVRGLVSMQASFMAFSAMIRRSVSFTPSLIGAALRDSERETILLALEAHYWNVAETARSLGIGRNTLHRKIKTYGLRNR